MNNIKEEEKNKVNAFLENHIDEPVKKCVVGMALLGFEPIFSCCGFSYKGEKIKKSHLGKPYIYLSFTSLTQSLKVHLIDICYESNWILNSAGRFLDFYSLSDFPNGHPWKNDDSPHRTEPFVLAINKLEEVLKRRVHFFKDEAVITDGNFLYKSEYDIKHWQYEPCLPWVVTKETFNNL